METTTKTKSGEGFFKMASLLLFPAWLIYAFMYEDLSFKNEQLVKSCLEKDSIIIEMRADARAVRDSLVTKDVVRRSVMIAKRKFELENEN